MDALEIFQGMDVYNQDKKILEKGTLDFLRGNAHRIWLVLEGDHGGQIYLTVRLDKIGNGAVLDQIDELHTDMECEAWSADNRGQGFTVFLTDHPKSGVEGGMGGGALVDGIWIHDEFRTEEWEARIYEVLKIKC